VGVRCVLSVDKKFVVVAKNFVEYVWEVGGWWVLILVKAG